MIDPYHGWNISLKPLIWGFLLSLVLILAAYFIAVEHLLAAWILVATIVGLAAIQAIIQVVLFLHVGLESKPRWNLMIFLFMVFIICVLVGGSMWIMHNLNYNMMLPS